VEILQEIGAAGADGGVDLTLTKAGGEPFRLKVMPAGPLGWALKSVLDTIRPVPLYRTHPEASYWHQYVPDSHALYIQYNVCESDPARPFKDFVREMASTADAHTIERVVVDLRLNGGGDSRVVTPLLDWLKSRSGLKSQVYGLIGPATFSSGMDAAIRLKREAGATLVGSAPGENLRSYGRIKAFTLPHSQLVVQYSTAFFAYAKENEAQMLTPDIAAPLTFDAVLSGHDPGLEAALTDHRRGLDDESAIRAIWKRAWNTSR
jgi:C-terminal processing protease CtpA/Prc